MRCPPGGPRRAYCRICLARAPLRHRACPQYKMRLELCRRAQANGVAILDAPTAATPDPALAPLARAEVRA
eukprot:100187-Lingulodinium_polyedra.AAC.1